MPVAGRAGLILHPVGFVGVFGPQHDNRTRRFERLGDFLPEPLATWDQAVPPDLVSGVLDRFDDRSGRFFVIPRIADEDVAITVTNSGYIKRTPITTYQRQGRGGKGRFGAAAKGGDFVEHLFIASTHAYIMIFTDDGMVYKLPVHEVPDAAASARLPVGPACGVDDGQGDYLNCPFTREEYDRFYDALVAADEGAPLGPTGGPLGIPHR